MYGYSEEDSDSMKLKIKVFNGKFENISQALKLTFDNNEYSASQLRDQLQLGEMDSALTFQIKCLPNVTEADLQDFCDFVTVMVKTSGILDEVDAPFSAITPSFGPGSTYGEMVYRITCPLKAELSGMSAGVIQAAGVNTVEVELKVDEVNKSGMFSLDLDVSRNAIELAQEMAGLPPELASFAQMYNEADMTFKFKTWEHLVGNAIIGELIPNEFKDEIEAVLSGNGVEQLLKAFAKKIVDELVVNEKNKTFAPFYNKAMMCFQELENIQFVVGNSLFKCDVVAPGLIQQLKVDVPEDNDDEVIDPTNYPATYTCPSHAHELTLQTNLYGGMGFACEKCQKYGKTYGYHCDICQYDLHTQCALDQ